jgi:CheY-like chemotaxis protein
VKQLLAFSRREVVRPTVLDLNEVVSDTHKLLRRTLGEHVELSTSLGSDLPRVEIDPGQVVQVIMNLAVNARDAMPKGGTVLVETAQRAVTDDAGQSLGLPTGSYVVLTISDTGHGMTEEVRSRAFEPFFTTKERGAGTGLGLATVYGIVQQAGGAITVHSEPQAGAAFQIYLPVVERKPRATRLPERTHDVGSETILIAEDEPAVRQLVARILTRRGYEVITAPDAHEAMQAYFARNGAIDLVVTDLVMPGGSGLQLAASIRELNPALPVIFMSGYSEKVALDQGMILTGEIVLSKPFAAEQITRLIRQVLDSGSDLSENSVHDVG